MLHEGTKMVKIADWAGLLDGRPTEPENFRVITQPIQRSVSGSSGTFLAAAADRSQWWVKPMNNQQAPRVIVSEHLVGRVGKLIGAPVCEVQIVQIPEEIEGWEFRPGSTLEHGFAHASAHVPDVVEKRPPLDHRASDDNRRRHAGILALHDLCWGNDSQWLYCETKDKAVYSHDHGHYFPDGPNWTSQTLVQHADEPHQYPDGGADLDPAELERLADKIAGMTRGGLAQILAAVPTSWDVENEDLEAVGYFLERRAAAVADRLRGMIGGAE